MSDISQFYGLHVCEVCVGMCTIICTCLHLLMCVCVCPRLSVSPSVCICVQVHGIMSPQRYFPISLTGCLFCVSASSWPPSASSSTTLLNRSDEVTFFFFPFLALSSSSSSSSPPPLFPSSSILLFLPSSSSPPLLLLPPPPFLLPSSPSPHPSLFVPLLPILLLPFPLLPSLLPPSTFISPTAHVLLSLTLVHSILLQYALWIAFPLFFILFAVSFVQFVSIHAIGKY